jgi:MFS family permease
MRVRSVQIMLVAVATGTMASRARAQPIAEQQPVVVELSRLVAHQARIRLRLASGTMVELRDAAVDGTTLVGRSAMGDSLVGYRFEELDRVWRRGSAAGVGLAIGAGLGLIGGAIGGVALAHWCLNLFEGPCPEPSGGEQVRGAVIGGLVGGGVVGAVGLLVAAPFRRWKTAYRARPARLQPIIAIDRVGLSFTW